MFSILVFVQYVPTFTIIFVFHLRIFTANFTIFSASFFVRVGFSAVVQRRRTPVTFTSICISRSFLRALKSILLSRPFQFSKGVISAVQRPLREAVSIIKILKNKLFIKLFHKITNFKIAIFVLDPFSTNN
jgi:hypothetical protein